MHFGAGLLYCHNSKQGAGGAKKSRGFLCHSGEGMKGFESGCTDVFIKAVLFFFSAPFFFFFLKTSFNAHDFVR